MTWAASPWGSAPWGAGPAEAASESAAAITAAAGTSTASSLAGKAAVAAALTAAAGASTAGALAGKATFTATLTAATGTSTASTLTGVAGTGATITAAAGTSTASTLTGSATFTSVITGAVGTSTAGTLTGSGASPYTRPTSDVTTTGWTATPGPGFYTAIDESTLNDADYITSPALGSGDPIIMGLGGTLTAGNYTLRVRGDRTGASGQIRVSLLNDSNVQQGVSGWQALTASWATYELQVTTTGSATRARFEVAA